jgi:hypothetical protein
MAATTTPTRSTGRLSVPRAARTPAVNSSESPGRKKPKNRPDSAKTVRMIPSVPNVSMSRSGLRRSTGWRG